MRPSPEARDLLNERRRWVRFWNRWGPLIAIALVFGAWFADSYYQRHASAEARIEREQAYIRSQDRCAGIVALPPVSFVLTGAPSTIYESLRLVSNESDQFRVLMLKDEVDARAVPKIVTFLPPPEKTQ